MEGRGSRTGVWRRLFLSPTDMDGWAVRVLTVAVVLSMAFSFFLLAQVRALQDTATNSRANRENFQGLQNTRVCLALKHLHLSAAEQQEAQC